MGESSRGNLKVMWPPERATGKLTVKRRNSFDQDWDEANAWKILLLNAVVTFGQDMKWALISIALPSTILDMHF